MKGPAQGRLESPHRHLAAPASGAGTLLLKSSSEIELRSVSLQMPPLSGKVLWKGERAFPVPPPSPGVSHSLLPPPWQETCFSCNVAAPPPS